MNNQMIVGNDRVLFRSFGGKVFFGLIFISLIHVGSAIPSYAQRVYGVASRTTVVHTGSTTVVRKTTAVATGPVGLCCGYIAVLPGGYRVVGGGVYVVGSVRYRATFYQGRTVYIRI